MLVRHLAITPMHKWNFGRIVWWTVGLLDELVKLDFDFYMSYLDHCYWYTPQVRCAFSHRGLNLQRGTLTW